ncbi:QacE family quaternary ammonium compound efflux SMR transporter [Saccharomonospora piscinae]|uniref:QacE family quaternary ammonium compound efflux SMR transporter n=1 Tax=Saccharomonospora piscinae TaxID=687388 RepID=A0A1V9A0B1_SACPI|nr:SMR family transporter [Saccharomonospora piscinae]OQO90597.1 QacE family quaternary ammonium compound efflux SMR transporter [Saccharomonospora piscinae]TLW93264.1 QacE family quaternary ammonium compound efflux SMR transporter [Saccharomonospora piscinae]
MNVYVLLAAAIAAEVTGTVSLKYTEGFTKPLPTAVVAVAYGAAFYLLARVLTLGMPVGVVYAIWSAAGVALVAVIGALFLGERMNLTMVAGLALVIGGVLLLELGGDR